MGGWLHPLVSTSVLPLPAHLLSAYRGRKGEKEQDTGLVVSPRWPPPSPPLAQQPLPAVSLPLWWAPGTSFPQAGSCVLPFCRLGDRILKATVMSTRKPAIAALPCVRQCWGTEGSQSRTLPSEVSCRGEVARERNTCTLPREGPVCRRQKTDFDPRQGRSGDASKLNMEGEACANQRGGGRCQGENIQSRLGTDTDSCSEWGKEGSTTKSPSLLERGES